MPKDAAGHYPLVAYQWAFGSFTLLLALTLIWYVWPRRQF